jgi:hypothetical protein
LGARWTVREVTATYHARDLRDGFTVTFADVGGTEWPFEVSADDVENELLLKVDPTAPTSLSLNGPAPSQLELKIQREGDGWRIANQSPTYTWGDCKAEAGNSMAKLPRLAPNGAVIVNGSDFQPPLGSTASMEVWVSCRANGTTMTVIGK